MAVAGEVLIANSERIDYDSLFNDIATSLTDVFCDRERPPESEIYGRSLSSIHRLGAFMVDRSLAEIVSSSEADQARVEFYTSVEEGFGTDEELGSGLEVRDFDERPVIDGRVMSKDLNRAVSDMTEAGLKCALRKYDSEKAEGDHRFLPQLTRSRWDHLNALQVDKMARGETEYNTIIVVSPFVEEAAAESGDEYWRNIGYVPHSRRGFVQVFHAKTGEIISGSLSFDGSNKKRIRQIFGQHDVEIPESEITDNWLQYAITGIMSEDEAKALATEIADQAGEQRPLRTNTVNVTREYGSIMNQVFDSSYVHVCESLFRGRQTEGVIGLIQQFANKAHQFNNHYSKALYKMRADTHEFTDNDAVILHELLVYSTIEMMRALHVKNIQQPHKRGFVNGNLDSVFAYLPQAIDAKRFQAVLGSYGAEGARNNRTYSACGLAISLGDSSGSARIDGLPDDPQTAYGGVENTHSRTSTGVDKYGPLEFTCKNGHWNRRPRDVLIKQCRIKSCKNSVAC